MSFQKFPKQICAQELLVKHVAPQSKEKFTGKSLSNTATMFENAVKNMKGNIEELQILKHLA